MKFEQHHKLIAYGILGIIILITFAVFIYIYVSDGSSKKEAQSAVQIEKSVPSVTGHTSLTPEQAGQKQALLTETEDQQRQPITRQQATAKDMLLLSQTKN